MRRALLWLGCAAAIAVGCGPSVVTPGQTGTTTGSGGSGGATTTTSTDGGAGGGISFTTGSGGGLACETDPTIFVDITGDVPFEHLDVSCAPTGRFVYGSAGPTPPHKTPPDPTPSEVDVRACTTGAAVDGLTVSAQGGMWPGTSMVVSIRFAHGGVEYWETPAQSGVLELDTVEPVGGVLEGTFSGVVAPNNGGGMPQLHIDGKFRVCRDYDLHLA